MFKNIRAFLFAPLSAALTVEAAAVIPVFLFCMVAVLQFGNTMETAVKFGTALADTGKQMGTAAYLSKYGGNAEGLEGLVITALSAAYAQNTVMSMAGDTSAVKNVNMLQSSILGEEEVIDLVMSYQIRSPIGIVPLPSQFFIQRARVRAWTGRAGSGGSSGSGETDETDMVVYVAETGVVYHTDPNCTHLCLSIQTADLITLDSRRNSGGEKYHACERCGGRAENSQVYITREGNRYHTSLTCSGLKRTVRQVLLKDINGLRICQKCGQNTAN